MLFHEFMPCLRYLSASQALTLEAICNRLIPSTPTEPGARDANVVSYIDQAISGFGTNLQDTYSLGLNALDRYCESEFGPCFADLDEQRQDSTLELFLGPPVIEGTSLERGAVNEDVPNDLLTRFLEVVLAHCLEGYFGDPGYGGNAGAVSWKLVGFPGAKWGYTAEQMVPGFDSSSISITTLADLQRSGLDEA